MRDDAARAQALESHDDGPGRPLARLLEGIACHLLGDRDRAQSLLQEGSRVAAVGAPSIHALCLAQLALIALEQDDWPRGAELAGRARAQVERFRLGEYPMMSLVFAVAALTQAQRGRVDAANDDRGAATRLLERLDDFMPWYLAEVNIVLARATLRLSDVAGARAFISAAEQASDATPESPVLDLWLEDAAAQVEGYSTSAPGAPTSLTGAELRVLGLLPTHLSFREIGLALNVSANTVKSQAQAVYRKLDASSRSEAVVHARTLGLVEV
jgi:LuxR family maltose regulon positive regulatory protein